MKKFALVIVTFCMIVILAGCESAQEAYDKGRDVGYNSGYEAGNTAGYEVGYQDGHDDGYYDGYDRGYADLTGEISEFGYFKGYSKGYNDGLYDCGGANALTMKVSMIAYEASEKSILSRVAYELIDRTLIVTLKEDDTMYFYYDVSKEVWLEFITAFEVGNDTLATDDYYNNNIVGKYECRKSE